jgi:hypothetical protein
VSLPRRSGSCPLWKRPSPAVTIAIVAASFACRCLPSQLPSPAVTAAVASCCLLLLSVPPDCCVVDRLLALHFLPPPHGIIATDIVVTISSSPLARSCCSSRCPPPALAVAVLDVIPCHRGCQHHLCRRSSCAAYDAAMAECGLRLKVDPRTGSETLAADRCQRCHRQRRQWRHCLRGGGGDDDDGTPPPCLTPQADHGTARQLVQPLFSQRTKQKPEAKQICLLTGYHT